jgi:hypothetical protein
VWRGEASAESGRIESGKSLERMDFADMGRSLRSSGEEVLRLYM